MAESRFPNHSKVLMTFSAGLSQNKTFSVPLHHFQLPSTFTFLGFIEWGLTFARTMICKENQQKFERNENC